MSQTATLPWETWLSYSHKSQDSKGSGEGEEQGWKRFLKPQSLLGVLARVTRPNLQGNYLQNDEVIQSAPPPPLVIETQDNGFTCHLACQDRNKTCRDRLSERHHQRKRSYTSANPNSLSASAATIPRSCSTRNSIRHSSKFTHELKNTQTYAFSHSHVQITLAGAHLPLFPFHANTGENSQVPFAHFWRH